MNSEQWEGLSWEDKYKMSCENNRPLIIDVESKDVSAFMEKNYMLLEETYNGEIILVGNPSDCEQVSEAINLACSIARKRVIVTRHAGAKAWLENKEIDAEVISHASIDDVVGCVVYGALPLHLAKFAAAIVAIDMNIPPEYRGKELSVSDMNKFGAKLSYYKVR